MRAAGPVMACLPPDRSARPTEARRRSAYFLARPIPETKGTPWPLENPDVRLQAVPCHPRPIEL